MTLKSKNRKKQSVSFWLIFVKFSFVIGEDFKQLCRDFVAIESEYGEFMELKGNLEEAKEALGVENASLREIRDAIQAKLVNLWYFFQIFGTDTD